MTGRPHRNIAPTGFAGSRARRLGWAGALGACLLMAFATPSLARPFIVGGKADTLQYVLAEITKQMIEKSGLEAQTRVGYATDAIRQAQIAGELDVTWDSTWTGYAFHHGMTEYKGPDEILQTLRSLDVENGLEWLDRSNINNSYALAVNLDFAAEACIHSIPELANALRNGLKIRFASDQECYKREDCLLRAEKLYDFKISQDQIEVMNVVDTPESLREREAELAVVYSTFGEIVAFDLELLEDPEHAFVETYLVPVVSASALQEAPQLKDIMNRISRALDTETLQDLDYRVEIVGQPIEQVARYFITLKGL